MKKRILFIINPISGTGRKKAIPSAIGKYLDHTRFDYSIRYTEHAGHAAEIAAEEAENGTDIVVAVGGDGTINEVARSLVHTSTALGIIPCGSGNGLARHLQIPTHPRGAIEIINRDTIHCLDYGKINGKPFFCTCGMGFDAFVSKKFSESGKRGLLQYAKNTIGIGLTYKSEHYIIDSEDQHIETDAFLIACANASQYGNNAFIAPTASMKDGVMDVIVMSPFPTLKGFYVLLQVFTKDILNSNHVQCFKSDHIHIHRDKPGAVHCDGDPLTMGTDIDVEIIRKSFNVVVNPDAHSKRTNIFQDMGKEIEDMFHPQSRHKAGEEKAEEERDDRFRLSRFVEAQSRNYDTALKETRNGKKRSHWMWYVFPQLAGLGRSETSRYYAISGTEEAKAYLRHSVLSARLYEITESLYTIEGKTAIDIFGKTDALKLQSSLTLFSSLCDEGNIFEKTLNKYFNGKPCAFTLRFIANSLEDESRTSESKE